MSMRCRNDVPRRGRLGLALLLAACCAVTAPVHAADHADAPTSKLDPNADITDVFLFRRAGKLVGVIAFGGTARPNPRVDGPTGRFDSDVVFAYHIDRDLDGKSDIDVLTRFGRNSAGAWGVEVENLPGAGAQYVYGPVENVLKSPTGLRVYAGLRDDPFFFDFEGFLATEDSFGDGSQSVGKFMFDPTRDSFGYRNLTAIVFEMDPEVVAQGQHKLHVWATTHRLMGTSP